jgi:thymidylate synthase (FAD)
VEPTFRSDIEVRLIHQYGEDRHIAEAAWVSSGKELEEDTSEKRVGGLIRSLLKQKHGTPFEAGYFAWHVEVPRAVRDEAVRHRIASFSSSSLRYTLALPEVYVPPRERPFKKVEGFKQMRPEYEPMDDQEYDEYSGFLRAGYKAAQIYNDLIMGMTDSTEAARWLTHDGTYVKFHIRLNPRSVMHFLALRTHNKDANHVSYPMWEIEQMALSMEKDFAEKLPLTYRAWQENGREAP